MFQRITVWLGVLIVYGIFFLWYTDLGGKLSASEIAMFTEKMQANRAADDPASQDAAAAMELSAELQRFMTEDSGRQFFMVNNIDLSEHPAPIAGAEPGETAPGLMRRYMEHIMPQLLQRACHPVFIGEVVLSALDVAGVDNAKNWDQAVLMRYKSRRAFMEVVTNPKMRGKHEFKIAALDKTIAYPVETSLYLGDPRLLLGLLLVVLGLVFQSSDKKTAWA